MLLNLTVRHAAHHVPHDDFACGVGRGQAQGVWRAQVVVVVLPGPFHLNTQTHNILYKQQKSVVHSKTVVSSSYKLWILRVLFSQMNGAAEGLQKGYFLAIMLKQ